MDFAYDGGEPLFSNVSLQIDTSWKLGLIGRNGRGKTTLLRLLLGDFSFDGVIDVPVKLGFFPYNVEDKTRVTLDIANEIATFETWQLERELSLPDVSEEVLTRCSWKTVATKKIDLSTK
jgi:lincosamide and streptogramin A transport system ATP-binding/permease protein